MKCQLERSQISEKENCCIDSIPISSLGIVCMAIENNYYSIIKFKFELSLANIIVIKTLPNKVNTTNKHRTVRKYNVKYR